MSMQQFCLRWNNHQPNFISVFSSLLNNETLVDVTLGAEGRHLQAHKVVLSACSTYFQSLFTVNPCQHPIVILKDVKFSDLKIMVDFMYYGEVNVSQDQLPSIIKTAESLKIKGLAEMHTASLTKWPSGSSEPGGGDRGESCSPSPSPLSPSFRRKRLRKTSTGSTSAGSADKPEEINEITLVATNIVKPEPHIVAQEGGENLRRPMNTTTESQGSIDEDQISIMSNMESSTATTPAQSEGSLQEVSQQSGANLGQSSVSSQPPAHHQGLQWTIMEHTYPRFALSSCQTNLSIQASSAFTTPEITATSSISEHQYQSAGGSNTTTSSSCALTSYPNSSSHGPLQHTTNSGAHQTKQLGTKRGRLLMRQPRVKKESEPGQRASPESEPGSPHIVPCSSSSSSSSVAHPVTPTLNLPPSREQSWEDPESCPTTSNTNLLTVTTPTNLLTVPQPSYLVKQHSHPLLPSQQPSGSGNYWIQRQHSNPEYPGRTTSPKVSDPIPLIKIEEGGSRQECKSSSRDTASSNSSTSGLRIIPAELLRSSSTPQTSSSASGTSESRVLSREGSSDQRLGHCPVQRPGPALGCNHCWNTIDTHGRILRRKTKYHCPECQINLCIVPCFQEFHERPREISTLRPLPKTSSI